MMNAALLGTIKGWPAMPSWFPTFMWTLGAILAVLGAVAVVSPARFAALTRRSDRWIDVNNLLSKLDTRVDIDRHVAPYTRALGMAVICSVTVLVWLYYRYL